jgi:hypothetical protein
MVGRRLEVLLADEVLPVSPELESRPDSPSILRDQFRSGDWCDCSIEPRPRGIEPKVEHDVWERGMSTAEGSSRQKWYAVRRGRRPGMFSSWEECSAQVTGFRHAEFKSFKSRAEAESYLQRLKG